MLSKYERALAAFQRVVALNGNLTPAARLYLAKTLKAIGQHDRASEELDNLLASSLPEGLAAAARKDSQELDKIDNSEESALKFYRLGDFKGAEADLQFYSEEELSLDGRQLLGMTFLKEKKYSQAARVLERAKSLPMLPEDKKNLLTELLNRARRGEAETHPYWLNVDLSYGSTNNAYADGESEPKTSSPLSRVQLGLGYHFNQRKTWSEKISYALYQENPEKAPETEILNQTLQAGLLYQKADLDFVVSPYFQTQTWARSLAGQKTGVSAKFIYSLDPFEYGLEMDFSNQESKNSDYSYFKGPAHYLKPWIGWWDQGIFIQLYWLSGVDGIDDIVYSDGSVLPLAQKYQGPGLRAVWKPSDRFATFLWLSSLERKYDHVSQPGSKERKDQEFDASLKLAYYFTPSFSLYQLSESISNKSTLGSSDVRDKNYQILVLTAGLSWDVF